MHPKFAALAESLHPSFVKLTECPPHTGRVRLPLGTPRCGVYLFSEGNDHLYVGRTDRLRDRHREHWPLKGEMWFAVTDQPIFAVAGFWQTTQIGNGFTMVTCAPNTLVAPIHPKAMVTILGADDIDTWLRGSYADIVALQKPYDAERMTVRGPVFPTRRNER